MCAYRVIGLGILLSAFAFGGACENPASAPAKQPAVPRADYESWVSIGVVGGTDTKTQNRVRRILNASAIDCLIEGSVVYGVRVPPENRDRATTILKADAAENGYWIEFADGTRPPRKADLQAKAGWEKALAAVRPGMDRKQLIDQLKELGVVGGCSESRNQAGKLLSGRYTLDADWDLDVEFAAGQKIKSARIVTSIPFTPSGGSSRITK